MCAWEAGRRFRRGWANSWPGLDNRKEEVRRRCRTILQSRAEAALRDFLPRFPLSVKCTSHLGFGLGFG